MKKLKLELEELRVDSFETAAGEMGRGTVDAHISLACTRENGATCGTGRTCHGGYTCDGEYTCNFKSCGDCGTYNCATNEYSCGALSCVYTCQVDC